MRIKKKKNVYSFLKSLKIFNTEYTLKYILENKCSVSRYGDGEFCVMLGGKNGFQQTDSNLAQRLIEVISNPIQCHILCLPYSYIDSKPFRIESKLFAYGYLAVNAEQQVMPYIDIKKKYFDANFSRFYMPYKNKGKSKHYLNLFREIWQDKDICIVEGEYSRLGVGNDLYDNAKSIIRVLCPAKDAFSKYEKIKKESIRYGKDRLILIALGMTATVLAYDLAKEGLWAIDIGHIDIEYEWYKMNAKYKCPIPNKFVNETGGIIFSNDVQSCKQYESEIVYKIL